MRVVLISFDALEYTLVEKYKCKTLMQQEYGQINLETYLRNRPKGYGSGHPITGEIYPIFITGVVPKDFCELKSGYNKKYPTIFSFAPKTLAIDIVGYGSHHSWVTELLGQNMFGGVYRDKIPLEVAEEAYYSYSDFKASLAQLMKIYNYDLIMVYFNYTDKLGHMYNNTLVKGEEINEEHIRKMYSKAEYYAYKFIEEFADDSLVIIFSDHGMLRGVHQHYGFWSSNIPLGEGSVIDLVDWHKIIRKWIDAE